MNPTPQPPQRSSDEVEQAEMWLNHKKTYADNGFNVIVDTPTYDKIHKAFINLKAETSALRKELEDSKRKHFSTFSKLNEKALEVTQLQSQLTTAQADAAGMRVALELLKLDYGHPWPNESSNTSDYRLKMLDKISNLLSTPTGQQILQELREKTDALRGLQIAVDNDGVSVFPNNALSAAALAAALIQTDAVLSRYPDREQGKI